MICRLSPPQYAMCPVSRQRLTNCGSVSLRNSSIRSWVSTWVSACGWNTNSTPNSSYSTRPSSLVPEIRFDHCSGSMSADSSTAPVCMSVYCSGSWIRYFAPTSVSSLASWLNSLMALASASLPLCNPANTVPPHTFRPRWSSSSRSCCGSCGRNPCGPSSVQTYPALATSSRYCLQPTCLSSLANQTPQESGAVPRVRRDRSRVGLLIGGSPRERG